jgi:hypothetical protein
MVGGGVGYWWILSVVLRLDASVGYSPPSMKVGGKMWRYRMHGRKQ